MKLLFLGTPQSAVPILQAIIESKHQVVGVISQPARKKGRGLVEEDSAVTKFAKDNNIPVFTPDKFNKDFFLEKIAKLGAQAGLVVAFGQIIPKDLLDVLKHGFINIHYSNLPKYRGAAPVQRAIMNGETSSAVTFFQITEGLDTGPVLKSISYKVNENISSNEMLAEMNVLACSAVENLMDELEEGTIKFLEQVGESSIANKLNDDDMRIDWSRDVKSTKDLIRAGTENLYAWTIFNGKKIKVKSCSSSDQNVNIAVGQVIIESKKVYVGCAGGCLVLEQIIPEGKNLMTAFSWTNGLQDKNNIVFS
jgi:methionyl-tRNA formyltransferase